MVSKQWGVASAAEGGLYSLSSPLSIRGLSVARSVALQMSKGGGMLAVAMWLMVSKQAVVVHMALAGARAALRACPCCACSKGSVSCGRWPQAFEAAVRSWAACCLPCGSRVVDGFQAGCARWRSRRNGVRALAGGVLPRGGWSQAVVVWLWQRPQRPLLATLDWEGQRVLSVATDCAISRCG